VHAAAAAVSAATVLGAPTPSGTILLTWKSKSEHPELKGRSGEGMMLLAMLLVTLNAAFGAANNCCDSALCEAEGQSCSKSECLQDPISSSWNCGTFREDGVDDDCLFLSASNCTIVGSECVDSNGREGYCEETSPAGHASRWPSWLAHGEKRVCARRLGGDGRCSGVGKVSGEMSPGTRRNHIAETKRQRAREQEAYIERLVSLLKRRDEPQGAEDNGDVSVIM